MITQERLRELLGYDELTGKFYWKGIHVNGWASDMSREAGSNFDGYRRIKIDGKNYLSHRLVWLWFNGEFPTARIDHINGDRSNNVQTNLRIATGSQNVMNVGIKSNNTSGIKGVFWNKFHNKWWATITKDGKQHHIGYFTSKMEAADAVRRKREELHGEFTNHG